MVRPLFGNVDNSIVLAVNGLHCPLMDDITLVVTNFYFFVGVVLCIYAYALWKDRYPRSLLFCAVLIVVIGCSDFICAGVIRPAVQQLRPTNPDSQVYAMLHIVKGYTGGIYGLPSCHAANSFAIAVFTSLWFRKKWITAVLTLWALAECYTRLYLGVHYPSDIVCGIAVGSLTAFAACRLLIRCRDVWTRRERKKIDTDIHNDRINI